MYKNIALLALLLPFSGYAITKQERQQEIIQQMNAFAMRALWIQDVIKHNFWTVYIHGEDFRKETADLYDKTMILQQELNQIELELAQEKTCVKQ